MTNLNQQLNQNNDVLEEPVILEFTEEELDKFNDNDLEELEKMLQQVEENFGVFKDFIEEFSNNRSVDATTHSKMLETLAQLRSTQVGQSLIEDVDFMKNFSDTITKNSSIVS